MRQYLSCKADHPDCILMFRLGDFYEMFFEDAVIASRALDLVLTSRDKNKEDPVPMCGVPHHAVRGYVGRLIESGHKVAICEQMEDPRKTRGIVKREVTQVVTPGVILDADQLDAKTSNYLMAVTASEPEGRRRVDEGGAGAGPEARGDGGASGVMGLAFVDVSTGEFMTAEVAEPDDLADELARIRPRQILVPAGDRERLESRWPALRLAPVEEAADEVFAGSEADSALLEEAAGAGGDWLSGKPDARRACAAIVRYVRSILPGRELPPFRIVDYIPSATLVLDEATLANLEVFETLMERRRQGSLLHVLDHTATPMGGRLLRRSLAFPLSRVAEIRRRQDAVAFLVDRPQLRADLRRGLSHLYDLERLNRRVACGMATPRDLGHLRDSLLATPGIAYIVAGSLGETAQDALEGMPELLKPPVDLLEDVAARLEETLVEAPPIGQREGGILRAGYSPELDELVALSQGGKERILAMETRERERTGLTGLKIKYNKVFGYTIEVSRAKAGSVPPDYVRKQTLANVERFVTPELAEHEARVLEADEKRIALEERMFLALREEVAAVEARLACLAEVLATLDLIASFAEVSARNDYCRPRVDDGDRIRVLDGRHPVVEQILGAGRFVPNDLTVASDDAQLIVVTGPNMAGKSTIIRQVALVTLMAHTGCFVPAREAEIGLVDRIFTRVGASDNLARGQSTFMVEMRESANILRHATRRSLIVLDEIGRGTSTYDGVSIAWAVAEHIHDHIRARTLFATHFHELCSLQDVKPRVRNLSVAVREYGGDVVFLHKLVQGGSSRSHGIQVAKLAGLPVEVTRRAQQILAHLEQAAEGGAVVGHGLPMMAPQLSIFEEMSAGGDRGADPAPIPDPDPRSARALVVLERLLTVDPDGLSPREAHELLYQLVSMARHEREP